MMRAITIKEPWATLIALGEKKFETRSWRTTHRGRLVIHAGRQLDKLALSQPDVNVALKNHNVSETNLNMGRVVAVCTVEDCLKTEQVSLDEQRLGDWRDGRFAWRLSDVRSLIRPIPMIGHQGIWRVERKLIEKGY